MPGPMAGDITPHQRQRLHRYLDEIEQWRRRVNLTTVPRDDAWRRHVEETMHLLELSSPARSMSLVDVGSGAGIPGVIIAVLRPDLAVTLLESSQRKAGFLVHVCGLLELSNTVVDCRRAEEAARDATTRERFAVAVSRAAAPPRRLSGLALPLLQPGGELWLMVASAAAAAAECSDLPAELGAGAPEAAAPGLLRIRKRQRA